jgi:transposase
VKEMFASYQEMYMNIDNLDLLINKRLEMVRFAHENGYKVASRFYKCSKNTIKKWCRRYALKGIKGLIDISRKPHNSPKKIKKEDIENITNVTKEAKEKKKYITVNNVRRKTGIKNYSDETINRYINKACGKKRNNKHEKTNGGSVDWKNKLKPFQLIQVDIKYLTDIDNLRPYLACIDNNYTGIKYKYQITARDVCTGFSIVAYCAEKSVTYTTIFLKTILYPFLNQFKELDLKKVVVQTDNGNEITNRYKRTKGREPLTTSFTLFIMKKFKKHKNIIPGHCTADSEVESFHWSIERDCLAWDDITNDQELIDCTSKYIERYTNEIIKTRGYCPKDKLKRGIQHYKYCMASTKNFNN